jgi:hypothetical protein
VIEIVAMVRGKRRRGSKSILIATACVILAAAVAAAATREATPLTITQYRAKENAICAGLSAYVPPAGTPVQRTVDLYDAFKTAIASALALPEPSGLRALRTQLADVLHQEETLFNVQLGLLKAGKITPTQLGDHLAQSSFSKTETAIWAKMGAKVCVKD